MKHDNYTGFGIYLTDNQQSLRFEVSQYTSFYNMVINDKVNLSDGKKHNIIAICNGRKIWTIVDGMKSKKVKTQDDRGVQKKKKYGRINNNGSMGIGRNPYVYDRVLTDLTIYEMIFFDGVVNEETIEKLSNK
jgi:hypothetical protein